MKYFEKLSEMTNTEKAVAIGAPLAVGAGAYALMRRGPKKNVFWGIDYEPPGFLRKLLYGDVKMVRSVKNVKPEKGVKNIYYSDRDFAPIRGSKMNVKYNTDQTVMSKVIQDKLVFGNLKGMDQVGIPTSNLKNVLKKSIGRPVKTPEDFARALKSVPDDMYFKPRWGYADQGHFSSKSVKRLRPGSKKFNELFEATKGNAYVAQPKAQYRKITSSTDKKSIGKPSTEVRSHVRVENGKIKSIGPAIKRWAENPIGLPIPGLNQVIKPGDAPSAKEVRKAVSVLVKNNPQHFKNKKMILGTDAFRDIKGKTRIFEMNDQSGFMHNPAVVSDFYKQVTGKENIPSAVIKSTGLTGLTAGGVLGGTALLKKKKRDDNEVLS